MAPIAPSASTRAAELHRARWGDASLVVRAPGRVNLIGEHTDYNDGFALPMALPFDTVLAVSARAGSDVEVVSEGFGSVTIQPSVRAHDVPSWALYIAGAIWLLHEMGVDAGGWRAAVSSDIPAGASLSSSAAIEVATILAVLEQRSLAWEPLDIARLGQRVENEIVGLPSGIMDQFISAGAVAGHASLLDSRRLTLTPCPIPSDVKVAVMDTGTRRRLAGGAYADRRNACRRAAELLGVSALRDATVEQLDTLRGDHPVEWRRARHVVSENERTLLAAGAMRNDRSRELGELMSQSHASLRDDFEVSSAALDEIVTVAEQSPGCLGARMTGGGFAGCAVALIDVGAVDTFGEHVVADYAHEDHTATVWICDASAGAARV